jgi:hypothetical protein
LGPTCWSGFYRRAAVLDLLGGFSRAVGDRFADVDLALRMQYIGLRCVSEPRSRVVTTSTGENRASFGYQRAAERLFWRNRVTAPASGALLRHTAFVAGEVLRNAIRPTAVLGRLVGLSEALNAGRHHRQLVAAAEASAPQRAAATAAPRVIRLGSRSFRVDTAQKTLPSVRPAGRSVRGRLAA